jgi:hypothetical protein
MTRAQMESGRRLRPAHHGRGREGVLLDLIVLPLTGLRDQSSVWSQVNGRSQIVSFLGGGRIRRGALSRSGSTTSSV